MEKLLCCICLLHHEKCKTFHEDKIRWLETNFRHLTHFVDSEMDFKDIESPIISKLFRNSLKRLQMLIQLVELHCPDWEALTEIIEYERFFKIYVTSRFPTAPRI
ncbi:UNVERIFIED_CONTAM: hypothetical protein RMT77_017231 [Armadillidium vulgare]